MRVVKMERKTGTVKFFDNPKGYGFIINDEGVDVFVHYRSIMGEGYKTLAEGETVTYLEIKSEKGLSAVEVERETRNQ